MEIKPFLENSTMIPIITQRDKVFISVSNIHVSTENMGSGFIEELMSVGGPVRHLAFSYCIFILCPNLLKSIFLCPVFRSANSEPVPQ